MDYLHAKLGSELKYVELYTISHSYDMFNMKHVVLHSINCKVSEHCTHRYITLHNAQMTGGDVKRNRESQTMQLNHSTWMTNWQWDSANVKCTLTQCVVLWYREKELLSRTTNGRRTVNNWLGFIFLGRRRQSSNFRTVLVMSISGQKVTCVGSRWWLNCSINCR